MRTIKANQVKAGMVIAYGDLTVKVSHDVKYGMFQSWDDAGIYIHGERSDGKDYPLWIWDLADVTVISE